MATRQKDVDESEIRTILDAASVLIGQGVMLTIRREENAYRVAVGSTGEPSIDSVAKPVLGDAVGEVCCNLRAKLRQRLDDAEGQAAKLRQILGDVHR